MDWFTFLKNAPYTKEELQIFADKKKITPEQFTEITKDR